MLKDQRKRKARSDKGKPQGRAKRQIAPEYALYLATRDYRPRRMTEAEVLHLLDQGCSICPHEATRIRAGKPYCEECWPIVSKIGEARAIAWAVRVSTHCRG